LFVDSRVWDRLVPLLAPRARCVMPDLPLGAHRIPMNGDADLSPPGLAQMIAELIRRLRLRDARRLARTLPAARLETIDDARTYVQLDQPQRLAELIAA
jgi:pimeloyl-ACP methyl ester carboxylesterase